MMNLFTKNLSVLCSAVAVTLLTVASATDISHAQWVGETSNTTADLHTVIVASSTTAGISGSNATMLWTTDQGTTWSPYTTNYPGNYLGMCFGDFDGNSIYLVGDMPGIVYTEDDGIDWNEAKIPTTTVLNAVSFLLADSIGIAVGSKGTVLRTTDFGVTWKAMQSGTQSDLFAVTMFTYEVDAVGANGTWIQSLDSGQTWKTYPLPTTNTLYSFDFDGLSETGWMVGDRTILRTTNYGNAWTVVPFSNPSVLRSVWLTDSLTAVVSGDNGRILKTTDRTNWTDQSTTTSKNIYSIQMYSTDSGWAAAAGGIILAWQKNPSSVATFSSTSSAHLDQNFPNPFTSSTRLQYEIPERAHVTVSIYDQLGRLAENLADAEQPAGTHALSWNAERFPAGIYFCKLRVGNTNLIERISLLR